MRCSHKIYFEKLIFSRSENDHTNRRRLSKKSKKNKAHRAFLFSWLAHFDSPQDGNTHQVPPLAPIESLVLLPTGSTKREEIWPANCQCDWQRVRLPRISSKAASPLQTSIWIIKLWYNSDPKKQKTWSLPGRQTVKLINHEILLLPFNFLSPSVPEGILLLYVCTFVLLFSQFWRENCWVTSAKTGRDFCSAPSRAPDSLQESLMSLVTSENRRTGPTQTRPPSQETTTESQ